ncbi:MAG TPA: ribonuclease HI family protein [bacterium]|nr:ribonuclease HI family protein [bacterium]HPL95471.1 ribonuclease HI family protein [bacterium]
MNKKLIIYTDGGARNNPGPAGIGAVIFDAKNLTKPLYLHKKYIGETTNNQAEYKAVVLGLEEAKKLGVTEVEVRLDSELVCKQINGQYKLKNPDFQDSFIKIFNLRQSFKKIIFKHVPREQNKLADKLVNEAIDNRN